MTSLLRQRLHLAGAVLALATTSACEPELVVGTAIVKEAACTPTEPPGVGSGGAGSEPMDITIPWSTGFEETGFCDFYRSGYCYGEPDSSHVIVDEPVHEGRSAAAFTVTSDPAANGTQTRCVLQGYMPRDAKYGAWLYVPALAQNSANWNLFHFRTGVPGGAPNATHGIWDVSLGNGADGSLHLYVFGFDGIARTPDPAPPIPIGEWFHVQFRLRRAPDATGLIGLYQDGVPLLEEMPPVTDDGEFGEWFVGNLASGLTPSESTVYIDELTIEAP